MAKASFQLDPNAMAYTDDEIVGKVNAAAANITRVDSVEVAAVLESATELLMSDTERTKLEEIAAGAEVNPADLAALDPAQDTKLNGIEALAEVNPTGLEMRNGIAGLTDTERQFVMTDPETGEFPVIAIQRATDGKLDVDYDDVAIP